MPELHSAAVIMGQVAVSSPYPSLSSCCSAQQRCLLSALRPSADEIKAMPGLTCVSPGIAQAALRGSGARCRSSSVTNRSIPSMGVSSPEEKSAF